MKIYEDESTNPNDRTLKENVESEAKVVLKIPIMFSSIDVYKNDKEHVGPGFATEILIITSSTSKIALDLIFKVKKENSDFLTWKTCFEEAKEMCQNKISRLQQAHNTIAFLGEMNATKSLTLPVSRSTEDLLDEQTGKREKFLVLRLLSLENYGHFYLGN